MSEEKKKLLVATTNRKKLVELQALLAKFNLDLVCLSDCENIQEVEETGVTFKENATLKAVGYAKQTGLLTLGEDSGLCCDALEDAPGVYSARFAGEEKSDQANNDKLLRLLSGIPDNSRGAHYTSAIAIAEPSGLIGVVEGEVHGAIAKEPKGGGGFGYDPLFFYPDFGKTFGEVPLEMKQGVSHRAKALKQATQLLAEYFAA